MDKTTAIMKRIKAYWTERSAAFNAVRLQELKSKNALAWAERIKPGLDLWWENNIKLIKEEDAFRLLDVGTGTGFFLFLLEPYIKDLAKMYGKKYELIGIDASPEMVQLARNNAADFKSPVSFYEMNAQALSFSDFSFHMIVSRNVTWTLEDVGRAYREWHRVLMKGGQLYNFDSHYGHVNFLDAKREKAGVHATVDECLLKECTEIKDCLPISKCERPLWDINELRRIGFGQVRCYADIRPYVQVDESLTYEDCPIFQLEAVK